MFFSCRFVRNYVVNNHKNSKNQIVLPLLLRLRQQHQQLRITNRSSNDQSSGSSSDTQKGNGSRNVEEGAPSSAANQIELSAFRLLDKHVRSNDLLSEVDPQSTNFSIEVGKLFSVAALFKASSTTARVKEGLEWVKTHDNLLQTVRQVMSLCMPILNFKDGSTNGREFILNVLYVPLLNALKREGEAGFSDASDVQGHSNNQTFRRSRGAENSESARKQHVTNLVSVFQLITKLMAPFGDENMTEQVDTERKDVTSSIDPVNKKELLEKCITLHTAASCTLFDSFKSNSNDTSNPVSVLSGVGLSAHEMNAILTSFIALEDGKAWAAAERTKDEKKMLRALIEVSYEKTIPILKYSLSQNTSVSHKVFDLLSMIQQLQLLGRLEVTNELLAKVIKQIAPAISSCNSKDLCNLSMTLLRLTSAHRPQSLSTSSSASESVANSPLPSPIPSATLRTIVVPIHQQIFSLSDSATSSGKSAFFPHESSVLLSSLSRLAESNEGVELSSDVVQRLCVSFCHPSQINHIQIGHLVPFLQGLVRFQDITAKRLHLKGAKKAEFQLRQHVPVIADTLDKCFLRIEAIVIKKKEAQVTDGSGNAAEREWIVSPADLASLLSSFSKLCFPNISSLFCVLEPVISNLTDIEDSPETFSKNVENVSHEQRLWINSLNTFINCLSLYETEENNTCKLKAEKLLDDLVQRNIATGLSTPKDVVQLFAVYRSSYSTTPATLSSSSDANSSEKMDNSLADDKTEETDQLSTSTRQSAVLTQNISNIVERLENMTPMCNLYECGALSLTLAALSETHSSVEDSSGVDASADPSSPTAFPKDRIRKVIGLLVDRANEIIAEESDGKFLNDVKRLLDAIHRLNIYCNCVPLVEYLSRCLTNFTVTKVTSGTEETSGVSEANRMQSFSLKRAILLTRTLLGCFSLSHLASGSVSSKILSSQNESEFALKLCDAAKSIAELCLTYFDEVKPEELEAENTVVLCFTMSQLYQKCELRLGNGSNAIYIDSRDETNSVALNNDDGDNVESNHLTEEVEDDFSQAAVEKRGDTDINASALETLRIALHDLYDAVGDVIIDSVLWSSFEAESSGKWTAEENSSRGMEEWSGKQINMLLQSFDHVGFVHHSLLSHILPQIHIFATDLKPLEVSLLLNSLSNMGFSNSQTISSILNEALLNKVYACSLKECHSILRTLERSGYVRATDYIVSVDELSDALAAAPVSNGRVDWTNSMDAKKTNMFLILCACILQRLNMLLAESYVELCREPLEDLVSIVRALSFFKQPPRLLFDSYYGLAVRRFVLDCELLAKNDTSPSGLAQSASQFKKMSLLLFENIFRLGLYNHQRVSSKALISSFSKLMRISTTETAIANDKSIGTQKLVSFVHVSQLHFVLYDQNLFYPLWNSEKAVVGGEESNVVRALQSGLVRKVETHFSAQNNKELTDEAFFKDFTHHVRKLSEAIVAAVPAKRDSTKNNVPFLVHQVVDKVLKNASLIEKASLHSLVTLSSLVHRVLLSYKGCSFVDWDGYEELCLTHLHKICQRFKINEESLTNASSSILSKIFLSVSIVECEVEDADFLFESEWQLLTDSLAKSSQLGSWRLPDAVDVALGVAYQDECIAVTNSKEANGNVQIEEPLEPFGLLTEEEGLDDQLEMCGNLALKTLQIYFQRTENHRVSLLPEVYRLLTSNEGIFVRWVFREFADHVYSDQYKTAVENLRATQRGREIPMTADTYVPQTTLGVLLMEVLYSSLLVLVRSINSGGSVPSLGTGSLKHVCDTVDKCLSQQSTNKAFTETKQIGDLTEVLDFLRSTKF